MTITTGCSSGTDNIVTNLANLMGTDSTNPNDDPDKTCQFASDYIDTDCLAGFYWSSTESASNPQNSAWGRYFASGGNTQSTSTKNGQYGVRCARGGVMSLYTDLPVFRDAWQLALRGFEYTKEFGREHKNTLGHT